MNIEEIYKKVLDCSFKVHTALGPGLLESAEESLFYELIQQGLKVEKQKALPLIYNEIRLDAGYRVDLLLENKVVDSKVNRCIRRHSFGANTYLSETFRL